MELKFHTNKNLDSVRGAKVDKIYVLGIIYKLCSLFIYNDHYI